jgi:aldehyde dehydrogenase (NAD+)
MSAERETPPSTAVGGKHWIAGEWRPGSTGVFELRQRIPPHEVLGCWPRGDAALVGEALRGAGEALRAWREGSPEERRGVLARAAEVLRDDDRWREGLARYLGLRDPELELELRALEGVRRSFDESLTDDVAELGVSVVFSHWSELVAVLFERALASLARGRGVLLVADERWPAGADAVARAFEAAGVPPGLVSLLHGAQEACREALVGGGDGRGDEGVRESGVAFSVDAWPREPQIGTYVVEEDADLARAATDVVQRAFGRSATLSGQRPGHVGRVLCHRKVFSAFTELLLATMQTSPDVRDPVPLVDSQAFNQLRTMWELGLDEGATLIFGGETFTGGTSRSSDRRVWPAIFTNIETEMALFQNTTPAPLLCLVRVESDQAGQELARRLG